MSRFVLPQLPKEWVSVHVGDVVDIVYGKGLRSAERVSSGNVPVYASSGEIDKHNLSLHPGPSIVIGRKGTVGSIHYVDQPFWCIDTAFYLDNVKHSLINLQFLAYMLQVVDLSRYSIVVGVPGINRRDIELQRIPLPPLPEQERIVAILREADELCRQQQAAVTTAQTLIPALFHHLFGDPATNPKEWSSTKLEKVCTRITDGTHQPPNFDDNGTVPFLFVSNIVNGKIDFNTEKFITPNTYDGLMRRCPVEVNDILYSTVGSYGVAVQVDTEQPFAFQRHIAHIKPDHAQIDATYLTAMLNSAYVKAQADRRARGIAQKTVNLNEIGRFQILLPPKPLQEEFGEIINQEVTSIQLEQYGGNEKFENLVKSLLARAFDGELTERYRQNNFALLQSEADKRDALLGHVRHLAAPVVAEATGVTQVLHGRDTLARSLSQPQQTVLQTIVAYLQENGRRYFTLPGFLADHLDISPNAARQNVELFEKVGLLTRVGRQVEPEGIPYFETFYRLTTPLEQP